MNKEVKLGHHLRWVVPLALLLSIFVAGIFGLVKLSDSLADSNAKKVRLELTDAFQKIENRRYQDALKGCYGANKILEKINDNRDALATLDSKIVQRFRLTNKKS